MFLSCGHQQAEDDPSDVCHECADDDDNLPGVNHILGECPGGTACTCDERPD